MNATLAYMTAKGYVHSSFVILTSEHRNEKSDASFFLSTHLLIGFALELYLKSFLLAKGFAEEKIRKDFGHDLEHLYSKSIENGLSRKYDKIIVPFKLGHSNFSYRYPKEDTDYPFIPIDELFGYLSKLDFEIDTTAGASVEYGKEPNNSIWDVPPNFREWVFKWP
ncbi:MAG: hypothetical protein RJA87_477 [Pseudomonadota bacterium]|jgi:hypothetical protein